MHKVARYRLAGLLAVGLLGAGGEWYFAQVAQDDSIAKAFLILALVSLIVVDQLIVTVFGTQQEEVLEAVRQLRQDVVRPVLNDPFMQKWSSARFYELLSQVRAAGDRHSAQHGDVRILTSFFIDITAITPVIQQMLERGVRFQICLMNPDNRDLLYARFALRKDGNLPEHARSQILRQVKVLTELPERMRDCTGAIQVRVSDLMPCGFVFHTRESIVFGLMPIEWSYEVGPMIRVSADSETGKVLSDDWNARWAAAKCLELKAIKAAEAVDG